MLKALYEMRVPNLLDQDDFEGEPDFSIMVLTVSSKIDQYPENEGHIIYVPEQVFLRILGVANTYNLKFPSHASQDLNTRWVYSYVEVQWLVDELEFLTKLLNDNHVINAISKLLSLCSMVLAKPNKLELAVEGP
jgi:hypothetical protein